MRKYSHKRSVIENILDAITLIFVGVILLLNTTNILPWSVWGSLITVFIDLWPVILIIIGFQIIFSFNQVLSSIFKILGTLTFVVFFIIAIAINSDSSNFFNKVLNQNVTDEFYIHSIKKANILNSSVDYKLKLTNGDYVIETTKSTENFIYIKGNYDKNTTQVKLDSRLSENVTNNLDNDFRKLYIEFEDKVYPVFNLNSKEKYNILLDSNTNPVDLNIDLVAGSLNMNTKNLNLTNFNFNMVAGESKITLGTWLTKNISVNVTAGNLDLTLPKNANFKFNINTVAGNITLDGINLKSGTTILNKEDTQFIEVDIENVSGNINLKTN